MENSFVRSACLPEVGMTSSQAPAPLPCSDLSLAASLSEGAWAIRSIAILLQAILIGAEAM